MMKTTDDTTISPFCLVALMVQAILSHHTGVWIAMPSVSGTNFSHGFWKPAVCFPTCRTWVTTWMFSLSQVSFFSTSMAPLSTILAAVMRTSQHHLAISAVGFWCMIAMITPFESLRAFMILLWAVAWCCKRALLICDPISWSILLRSGILSSALRIRHLSTFLVPVVGAGPGYASFFWFGAGTVSHCLTAVGIDNVAPFATDVVLAWFGVGVGFCVCFRIGINLSGLPGCSCWRSWGLSSPSVWFRSACIEGSRPTR